MLRNLIALLGFSALAACGGGGSDTTPSGVPVAKAGCPSQFVGSGSRVSQGGIVQGGSNPQRAIDGDFGSFASLFAGGTDANVSDTAVYASSASQLDLRATAREGLSFPAGSRVGAIAQLATGATTQQVVTVTTYLGGVLQETFSGGSHAGSTTPSDDELFSYATSKAYDAVQFSVRLSGHAGTERAEVKVYEVCG